MSDQDPMPTGDPVASDPVASDPRQRPPDPAGTVPLYDPAALLPPEREPFSGPWHAKSVAAEAPAPALPEAVSPSPASESRFTPRFQFVLGALVAVALASVALAVAIFTHHDSATDLGNGVTAATWSDWQPSASATDDLPTQIAKHVGTEYRYANGRQMLAITGGLLAYQAGGLQLPVAVAFYRGANLQVVQDAGIFYRLCGLGESCSIQHGRPSLERGLLVRRAALELALYTFEYLPAAKQVAVSMPPAQGDRPIARAIYFRRADLQAELDRPLADTLAPRTLTPRAANVPPESLRVEELTSVYNFVYRIVDQAAYMVLDRAG